MFDCSIGCFLVDKNNIFVLVCELKVNLNFDDFMVRMEGTLLRDNAFRKYTFFCKVERVWLEKRLDFAHPYVLNNGAPISWASSIMSVYGDTSHHLQIHLI